MVHSFFIQLTEGIHSTFFSSLYTFCLFGYSHSRLKCLEWISIFFALHAAEFINNYFLSSRLQWNVFFFASSFGTNYFELFIRWQNRHQSCFFFAWLLRDFVISQSCIKNLKKTWWFFSLCRINERENKILFLYTLHHQLNRTRISTY